MTNAFVEQLEAIVYDPHSEELRKKFFGILATVDKTGVAQWITAASDLRARGVIDADGWVYFAAMFLECLTFGDAVTDPDLVRIQREIDALDAVESWKRGDDDDGEAWKESDTEYDVDGSPEMRALFAAYDARAHEVMAEYLGELGYHEIAEVVERNYETFLDRSEIGANKVFGS
jgi:hypothetical protein